MRVQALDADGYALYMQITLHARDSGEWGECPAGLTSAQALGKAFLPLMHRMDVPRREWSAAAKAYERLADAKMIWARDGKLRVYPYWDPDLHTVDVALLPGMR